MSTNSDWQSRNLKSSGIGREVGSWFTTLSLSAKRRGEFPFPLKFSVTFTFILRFLPFSVFPTFFPFFPFFPSVFPVSLFFSSKMGETGKRFFPVFTGISRFSGFYRFSSSQFLVIFLSVFSSIPKNSATAFQVFNSCFFCSISSLSKRIAGRPPLLPSS